MLQVVRSEHQLSPALSYALTDPKHVLELALAERGIHPKWLARGKLRLEFIDIAAAASHKVLAIRADDVLYISVGVQPTPIHSEVHIAIGEQVQNRERIVVEWEAHLRSGPHTGDDLIVGVMFRATCVTIKKEFALTSRPPHELPCSLLNVVCLC